MGANTSNKYEEHRYIPRRLLLQLHITERCNLNCSHCYQETNSKEELGLQDLIKIFGQFKNLLEMWRVEATPHPVGGHISIAGGEPFVRKDCFDLLEILSSNKEYFSFAILTNGSYVDAAMAGRLKKLLPTFVQVSIEGTQSTHDSIRGPGSFEHAIKALKHLTRKRIRTLISFTAHRGNFREFPDVARLGRKLRVSSVWADRFIPSGRGSAISELVLTPNETREFIEIMNNARTMPALPGIRRTEIAMHRALQFLVSDERPYFCTAGDTLITILPNGDLCPCRRMPIRVGNILETPLIDLYYNSELFLSLRDRSHFSDGCKSCAYTKRCRGGLRCLSYALTGNPFNTDPGCWIAASEKTDSTPVPGNTDRLLRDFLEYNPIGRIEVKGKKEL